MKVMDSVRRDLPATWNRWQFGVQQNGRAKVSDLAIFRCKTLISGIWSTADSAQVTKYCDLRLRSPVIG